MIAMELGLSQLSVGLMVMGLMLALMVIRIPIAATMLIPGFIGYILLSSPAGLMSYMKGVAYAKLAVYDLSVIPLFLLMGYFATQGGLSRDLFRAANALIGHVKGGMAMAAVLACALFGTVCGSSIATAATIGQVAIPEMKKLGYSGRVYTATLAAGGTLGILIPPSVILVVYAILTEQNIAKLFAAAAIPGIIAVIGYMCAVAWTARKYPQHVPAGVRLSRAERLAAYKPVWPILIIFITVFGGIYGGVFTPTEAASVGAVCTFLVAFLKGELKWRGIQKSLLGTAQNSGMIFLIFLGADLMNSALALSQMPAQLAAFVASSGISPIAIIVMVLVFYIILGGVMDEMSMILLTLPIIFPIIMGLDLYGLNAEQKAIWFGMLILMVVQIGLIAPPVGLNVYVINGMAKDVPMIESYKGVMPFLVTDFIRTALLVIFPGLSLWLVQFVR
jgi:tripartite ATP-independent transporter DctM subunit